MTSRHTAALIATALVMVTMGCSSAGPATRTTLALRYAADADGAWHAGRYDVAARRYERAVHQARAQDDQALVQTLLVRQAQALLAAGTVKLALPRALEAVDLAKLHQRDRHNPLLLVGRCYALLGDSARARSALTAAAAGGGCVAMSAYSGLGALDAQSGAHDAAQRHYRQAEKTSCDSPSVRAQLHYNWGRLLLRAKDYAGAKRRLNRAVSLFHSGRDETGLADALHALGQVDKASGRKALAADAFRRAAHTAWAAGRPRMAAWNFGLAAQLLRALGRGVEADALNRQGQAALKAAKDRD